MGQDTKYEVQPGDVATVIANLLGINGGGTTANSGYTYTPLEQGTFEESDATKAAYKAKTDAESAVTDRGNYGWIRDDELKGYISQWEGRPKFSYDFNADALYQQYKDKYIQQGKMAMADTIGQASAMTGGYGNSYAQSVGQQTYQAHLGQLNDIIPELYQMAYDRHNQEGQDLLNTISLLRGERDFDYGKWSDETNRLIADRTYYGDEYNNLYGRDYAKYMADESFKQTEHTNEENMGYANYRDAIEDKKWAADYVLSDRELKIAEEEWDAKKNPQNYPNYTDPPKDEEEDYKDEVDKYEQKDTYADWDASDWEGYFASIRQSEGKAAAEKELTKFTSKGLIPQKFVGVAAIGARGGGGGH